MRRFYIDKQNISGKSAVISGQDVKHLKNVLRLEPGDTVCVFDGTGNEYKAAIRTLDSRNAELDILEPLNPVSEPPVRITVAQAFLKEKKMDTLVRQLTELGMYRWLPFIAERSVAKPDEKRLKTRKERWETIAKESLKQCMRSKTPIIHDTVFFKDVLTISDECDLKLFFWEKEQITMAEIKKNIKKTPEDIIILLGPEGGFSTEEVEAAKKKGFITTSLGPRILKAETASVAASTLVQYIFGDLG